MTLATYEKDSYQQFLETEVVRAGVERGRSWAESRDTIFYPEGGGQPADQGMLGEARVIDVGKVEGVVRHYLDKAVEVGSVRLELDWERRFDHMQHHTAQHLLSAIAEDRFGLSTTSFHLGSERCDIEVDGAVDGVLAQRIEEAVAAEIRSAHRVDSFRIDPEELKNYSVRSRGLPEGFVGTVRLVEIEGVDLATCGGTHLGNTAEIEALAIVGLESRRGGTRVEFVVGRRLRSLLREDERLLAELRAELNVGTEELLSGCQTRGAQLKGLRRELNKERAELATAIGERLAVARQQSEAPGEGLTYAHLAGRDIGFLRRVAAAIGGPTVLTGGSGDAQCLIVAGGVSDEQLRRCGDRVAELLGGRGGGRGVYQAKISDRDQLDRALDIVREMLA